MITVRNDSASSEVANCEPYASRRLSGLPPFGEGHSPTDRDDPALLP